MRTISLLPALLLLMMLSPLTLRSESAFYFNGSSSYVNMGANKYPGLTSLTIEAWIKRASTLSQYNGIAGQGYYQIGQYGFGLLIGQGGNAAIQVRHDSLSYSPAANIAYDDTWHHIAGVVDGTNAYFYVDGILTNALVVPVFPFTTDKRFAVGATDKNGWQHFYNGLIADVRLWSHARSTGEIADNMHRRLNGNEAGLLGYWPLDDGSDVTTVRDLTAAGNHGTITKAAWTNDTTLDLVFAHPDGFFGASSFSVCDPLTGNSRYTSTNTVEITGLVKPPGYTAYQITFSGSVSAVQEHAWLDIAEMSKFITFAWPEAYQEVTPYIWYTNLTAAVPLRRAATAPPMHFVPIDHLNTVAMPQAGSYIEITETIPLTLSSPFTVEGWYRFNDFATISSLYTRNATPRASPQSHIFAVGAGGTALCAYTGESGSPVKTWRDVELPEALQLGRWYHIAFVYAGTTLYYYLDGELMGTQPFTHGVVEKQVTRLGGYSNSSDLIGSMSEVRLWDYARTQADLRAMMHQRLKGDDAGLLGYWPFTDSSGIIATDHSGNGNHGTLINAAWELDGELTLALPDRAPFALALPFKVADPVTGSTRVTDKNTVDVPALAIPDGYTHYQLTQSADADTLGSWLSSDTPPPAISFTTPPAHTNLAFHAWFTNISEEVVLRRATAEIAFSATPPEPILIFNNPPSNVLLNDPAHLRLNGTPFTFEVWANFHDFNSTTAFYSCNIKARSKPYSHMFVVGEYGTMMRAYTGENGNPKNGWVDALLPQPLQLNRWYHFAYSYDGDAISFYCDGELISKQSYSYGYVSKHVTRLGGYADSSDMSGVINEARLWDYCRSDAEIRELMNRRLHGSEAGLLGYWPLNESGGTVVLDHSGHHATGDVINATWEYDADIGPLLPANAPFISDTPFTVSDAATGNTQYTYTNAVTLSTLDLPADYDRFQITTDPDPEALNPTGWHDNNAIPFLFDFSAPEGLTAMTFYLWFTNATDAVTLRRGTSHITYSPIPVRSVTKFVGDGSYITVGTPSHLQLNGAPFTIEGWMYCNVLKSRNMLYCKSNAARGSPYSHMFGFINQGTEISARTGLSSTWHSITLDNPLEIERWYHVAYSFDGSFLSYFIDGELVGAVPFSYGNTTAHPVFLGSYSDAHDLEGSLSDIRVWNYARTADETRDLMPWRLHGGDEGLIAYWPLDEGSGSQTADHSGNNADGTLVNVFWQSDNQLPAKLPWQADFITIRPFAVADINSGNRFSTNTNEVEIATFPAPEGYSHYQITTEPFSSSIGPNWQSRTTAPQTFVFARPNGDTNVAFYAWFTNKTANVTLRRSRATIIFVDQPLLPTTLELSGSASRVTVGTPAQLQLSNAPFTIEGWMYFHRLKARDMLYSKNNPLRGTPYSHLFGFIDNGTYISARTGLSSAWQSVKLTPPLNTEQWYHVAYRFDGTELTYFIDGKIVGAHPFEYGNTIDHPVTIGGHNDNADIDGRVSEVRVWNYARSSSAIRHMRHRRLRGDDEGLLGYWRMNDGMGATTVADRSGFASHGNIDNAIWIADPTLETELPGRFPFRDAFPLTMADFVTGSPHFTNSNSVEVVDFPLPDGYSHFYVTESPAAPPAAVEAWNPAAAAPDSLTFARPPHDTNVIIYTWFTNFTASVPLRRSLSTITYTTVAPTAIANATLQRLLTPDHPVLIYPEYLNNNSVGNSTEVDTDLLTIPLHTFELTIIDGPGTDNLPSDPGILSITQPGLYIIELKAINAAGNSDTATTTLTIDYWDNEAFTWSGAANANWSDARNWNLHSPPCSGSAVVLSLKNGTLTLDTTTPLLSSFTQSNGTLTFSGANTVLHANEVTLTAGTVNHLANSAKAPPWGVSNSVNITAQNITIAASAAINADRLGFSGGVGVDGYGPGGGKMGASSSTSSSGGGGGYGGHGGRYSTRGEGGITYGDYKQPLLPGSGGGGRNGLANAGGAGGGLVQLRAANQLTINGTITANGYKAPHANTGAGSGGGIYLSCRLLAGSGTITANGGVAGNTSGAGAGGRIALWRASERATLTVSADAGTGTNQNNLENGTIFRNAPYGSIIVIR